MAASPLYSVLLCTHAIVCDHCSPAASLGMCMGVSELFGRRSDLSQFTLHLSGAHGPPSLPPELIVSVDRLAGLAESRQVLGLIGSLE